MSQGSTKKAGSHHQHFPLAGIMWLMQKCLGTLQYLHLTRLVELKTFIQINANLRNSGLFRKVQQFLLTLIIAPLISIILVQIPDILDT